MFYWQNDAVNIYSAEGKTFNDPKISYFPFLLKNPYLLV